MSNERITVLGAGSWGTALSCLLGGKGNQVVLWDRDEQLTAAITERRVNPRYLPDSSLPESLTATSNLKEAASEADWIIIAVASDGIRTVVSELAPYLQARTSVISACKGLEAETGLTTSEIVDTLLSDTTFSGLAVLSGPNLAGELIRGIPSATVIASYDPSVARAAQDLLMTDRSFRVYTHNDVKGVELGGALKNVLAIGAGISDGLGFGDNTKAALMTRGLMEMTQLGVASGGKALTFLGLSGVGDLMATMASRLSRNYRVGLSLAQRKPIDEILKDLHQAAEGVPTALAARVLSQRYRIPTPVLSTINDVIHNGKSPGVAVEELMGRGPRDEFVSS